MALQLTNSPHCASFFLMCLLLRPHFLQASCSGFCAGGVTDMPFLATSSLTRKLLCICKMHTPRTTLFLSLLLIPAYARQPVLSAAWSSEVLLRHRLDQLLPSERQALAGVKVEALQTLLVQQQQGLLASVPSKCGIPDSVDCDNTTWCDDKGVCADVCARGSVKLSQWQQWTMAYQINMARKQPLCYMQLLASHNSAVTLADGYGNRDNLYSSYLAWLKTLGASTRLHTNNQVFSLTDQLNMGVRVLELDVHFVANELRIAHCGGLHSGLFDRVVSLVNAVAKLLGKPEMVWDAETVGCSPSLSSIAVKDQRLFADALEEIAVWMHEPQNSQEFLFLFFDNQPDLATWKKIPAFLEQLTQHFPVDWILTPPEARSMLSAAGDGGAAPTMEQLLARGKRLLLLSSTDYKDEADTLVFSNATMPALCPYDEAWPEQFIYHQAHAVPPSNQLQQRHGLDPNQCYYSQPAHHGRPPSEHELLFTGTMIRMPACELVWGPLDCHFHGGEPNKGLVMNETQLTQVTACGLNFPAPDMLTPERAAAHLWAWAPDHPPVELLGSPLSALQRGGIMPSRASRQLLEDAACTFADAKDGRWRTGACPALDAEGVVVVCRLSQPGQQQQVQQRLHVKGVQPESLRQLQHTELWALVALSSCSSLPSESSSCCPAGYTHDIPHTAVDNLLLKQSLRARKASRGLLPLKPPNYRPSWLL